MSVKNEVKKLSLKKGDILVIQRSFSATNWQETLRAAAKEAGLNFNVPVIFVDSIDEIAIVRQVK